MQTCPSSPPPPGAPRWVAMFHRPSDGSWRVGAESPHRGPVLYAAGQMAQTLRARGAAARVEVWGPAADGGGWHRFTAPAPAVAETQAAADAPAAEGGKLAERMGDRRQQVLMAGLSRAGLYDLGAEDQRAVAALVDRLDETTLRRVAHWLASAGSAGGPLGSDTS
ncbi:hypothetical protein [Streptomyces sp. enrichment culture]|uniref:hypothetical protein n=1 Tax=Streptomyces sp. enrichment culture TaxID=1795815 RepID=UPI003F56161D